MLYQLSYSGSAQKGYAAPAVRENPAVVAELSERDRAFTWRDGERAIVFRSAVVSEAHDVLAAEGFERFDLLTTPRAVASAPVELPERALSVQYVAQGQVPEVAAEVAERASARDLVALGGGRVIDVAKAIAAARGGRVAAIPTTLSGAPMTAFHRLPAGVLEGRRVRPALVLADPPLMASLGEPRLRATAMNALAHGAEALYGPLANPLATLAALRGAALMSGALLAEPASRDLEALALGALLCSYAVGSALYGFHHVVCQSIVRVMGTPHAETNAAMLPRTLRVMREREPAAIAALARALGVEPGRLAQRVERLGGGRRRLRDLGAEEAQVADVVKAILARPELRRTPDPPGAAELEALVESAL